jgi:DNA primase
MGPDRARHGERLHQLAKTSGNRGIHIFWRIEPLWEFPVVWRAALAFARELERRLPRKVTTAWWKEERGRRVFIDFNQNARDRTMASAYSVRARIDATVSAPVSWDELPDVETEYFTMTTMPARFTAMGDIQAAMDESVWTCACCSSGSSARRRKGRRGSVPAELPGCRASRSGFSRHAPANRSAM